MVATDQTTILKVFEHPEVLFVLFGAKFCFLKIFGGIFHLISLLRQHFQNIYTNIMNSINIMVCGGMLMVILVRKSNLIFWKV